MFFPSELKGDCIYQIFKMSLSLLLISFQDKHTNLLKVGKEFATIEMVKEL